MWQLPLVFLIALVLRVVLNRGQTQGTPDERVYSTYAEKWTPGLNHRRFIAAFLGKSDLEIPPTRYGFFAVCAAVRRLKIPAYQSVTWVAAVSGAIATPIAYGLTHSLPASFLVTLSPLSLLLGRRALQDTFAALLVLVALLAVHLQNVWLLGAAVLLSTATREALVLYIPALLLAWGLRTGHWVTGGLAVTAGTLGAIGGYYALGGRQLVEVFRKLKQPTDYVRRLQSGAPHRVLVDLLLVSPVTTVGAIVAANWAPWWLSGFVGLGLVTHAFITPKNVRFLLVLDLGARMMCAWLPGPWSWTLIGVSSLADSRLYRAFRDTRDPVTYNLVVQSGMYLEK